MKIITIYELLRLVKDDKAPKKIKYNGKIYDYEDYDYFCSDYGYLFDRYNVSGILNDEVEILEEEKKIPEKLDIRQEKNIKNNWKWKVYGKEHSYNISTPQKIIADKLNEILNYLKSKGE